ncbi:hypothetical protein CC79DRAFT_1368865 [Sarocladium strictum]
MTDRSSKEGTSLEPGTEPRIKRERTEDLSEKSEAKSIKVISEREDGNATNGNEAPFAFLCDEEDNAKRLVMKEDARNAALRNVLEVKKLLMGEISGSREQDANGAKNIVKRIDNMLEKNKNCQKVLVGVCGGTGVGKTSTLNAMLGFDELLPSGQEEATTAVPCLVSYNENDREGHECRAEVHFQDKESIRDELRMMLSYFAARADAEEDDQPSDVRECTAMIAQSMERFSPVWKLDEHEIEQRLFEEDDADDAPDQISSNVTDHISPVSDKIQAQDDRENATLDWIFSLNEDINKLLSAGTLSMAQSTPKLLASEMKKYLDSTEGAHSQDASRKFAAWPLVKEVHVFVKSELLTSGVCLVDLPGIGDNNKTRNSVMGKYLSRLDLTIIVASIARGKDTRDFNDLLSAQQETTMKLDGTLNKDHFAIVFTKIDDIQPEKYSFHNAVDKRQYSHLNAIDRERVDRSGKLRQEIKRAEKAISKARQRMGSKPATDPRVVKQERVIKIIQRKLETFSKMQGIASVQSKISRHRQVHLAIIARNRYVQSCVQEGFASRQRTQPRRRRGARGSTAAPESAQPVPPQQHIAEIFMTSARGFGEIAHNAKPLPGVPTERYTGIPALKQWILKNAALHREAHLDNVLADLRVLLELINSWVQANSRSAKGPQPRATPKYVEEELESVHQAQLKVHRKIIDRACHAVDQLNPLGHAETVRRKVHHRTVPIVQDFVRKYPEKPRDTEPMHHMTYNAVMEHGGCYRSPTTEQRYDWVQKLGVPFIEGLVAYWQEALTKGTKHITEVTLELIKKNWEFYARDILVEIFKLDPVLRTELADIGTTMKASASSFISDVERIAHDLHEKIARIHHDAIGPSLAREFGEIIQEALLITGKYLHFTTHKPEISLTRCVSGAGSFQKRQEFLKHKALTAHDRMFRAVWDTLSRMLKAVQAEAKHELRALPAKVMAEVKSVFHLRLNAETTDDAGDTVSEVDGIAHRWKKEWSFPLTNDDHVFKQQLGIPETISLQDFGKAHPVVSSNGVNYFDTIESGNDSLDIAADEEALDELLDQLDF